MTLIFSQCPGSSRVPSLLLQPPTWVPKPTFSLSTLSKPQRMGRGRIWPGKRLPECAVPFPCRRDRSGDRWCHFVGVECWTPKQSCASGDPPPSDSGAGGSLSPRRAESLSLRQRGSSRNGSNEEGQIQLRKSLRYGPCGTSATPVAPSSSVDKTSYHIIGAVQLQYGENFGP